MLTLPEGLLLLTLDDEKGHVLPCSAQYIDYGLGAAILMELNLHGNITVTKESVAVNHLKSTGHDLLDEALENIAASRKIHSPKWWISSHSKLLKNAKEGFLDTLVEDGILKEETHYFLWVFPRTRYPSENDSPENEIRHQVRNVVLNGAAPDESVALLISLLSVCHLGKEVFPELKSKESSRVLKEIADSDLIGKAASEANGEAVAAAAAVIFLASTNQNIDIGPG